MSQTKINIIYFVILLLFTVYFFIWPSENDIIKDTLLPGAIMAVVGILSSGLTTILKNIKRLCLYIPCTLWFRNTNIRVSISYIYRIKIKNKYLLVINKRDRHLQPVGGVYKSLSDSVKELERLGVKADNLFETEDGVAKRDLRLFLKGKELIPFLDWFDSQEDRELSPWREFHEELVVTGILSVVNFPYVNYSYKGRVQTPIIELNVGGKGYFQYDVYDLVLSDRQQKELEALYDKGDGEQYRWVTEDQIQKLGYSDKNCSGSVDVINPHTKWTLNMKYSR